MAIKRSWAICQKNSIKNILLVAYQEQLTNLVDFYVKNGYSKSYNKISYFDDGETSYDLIEMSKKIN